MSTPLSVLMVEDSEDACLLVEAELQKHGYQPVWRRVDTAEAMQRALASQAWDVIVADFVVPGFDALQSVKLARELAPDVPVLVVSGNLGEEVAVAVMKAGAQDYVTKGNLTRLVPAIERELRDAAQRRAQHQAQAVLERREILSRAVLDSLPMEIAVLDRDGTVLSTNAVRDTLGRARVLARTEGEAPDYLEVFRHVPDISSVNKVRAGVEGVLSGKLTSFTFEYARSVQGRTRWLLLHASPLIDSGGAVLSHTDITETKRAEEALRQSEARFRDVVESLGEGLVLTGPNDVIWYANSRMGQMIGYDPSEMIERPVSAFIRVAETSIGGAGPPKSDRAEMELVHQDGRTFWAEINAAPLLDSQGQVSGTVRAITDITERREAREALRKSQAGLLLAQRIGHLGSWELDLASSRMEWSSETCRILDHTPSGVPPTWEQFLELIHRDDRPRVKLAFDHAVQERGSCRADSRVTRRDGSERFVHLQAQAILDSSERSIQLIGTIQDITDRKLLEEQLRRSQKMEAVGQLAGGIAHDFNNILTVIQGYTELMTSQGELRPQTRAYANQIAISADRASKLTRQLLAFSRKQVMQPKTLHLNDLLNNLSAMLQRLLGEQSRLNLNLEPDLPAVLADSGMMEQVLVNLVVNARDAMPKGGRLTIETSTHQIDPDYCRIHTEAVPGRFICLGVIDTGCGMNPDTLSHMFEPFFTTKDVGRGTGLGLSTVYGIVKQHQGWIQVASEVGHGTAFKVFLPVTGTTGAPAPRSAPKALVARGTESILLVEDEPPLRGLARSILEQAGYRVLEAGSGPEAVEVWKQANGKFDLLLTDMVMPGGMSGRDLALELQSRDASLKVLYTTGYSIDFVESDLLLREGINFLPKPYNGTSLAQAVRGCLDRKG